MAEITAAMVRTLREQTGAGMMDCKKALTAEDGDMDAAIDWLRTKGLSAAAKKAGRAASEGLVGVMAAGTVGAMVEVNAETDFVGRNDQFQAFVSTTVKMASEHSIDVEAFKKIPYSDERSVEEELTHLISVIGENMMLRRLSVLEVSKGVVASYLHGGVADGLGRIGVLVGLESDGDAKALEALGKKIAMHIAAARPVSLTIDEVPQDLLDREKAILVEQAKESGKPDNVVEKMVEGRLRKYYEESVLLEQVFVIDGETKIKDVIANAAKDLGCEVKLAGFERLELGEGVEKEEDDFAAEVASMTK